MALLVGIAPRCRFFRRGGRTRTVLVVLASLIGSAFMPARAQMLIRPAVDGTRVTLLPPDMAVLESPAARRDLACVVTPRRAELGFDLRFHTGFDVSLPLKEIEGEGDVLTVVLRVYPQNARDQVAFFSEHIAVPFIEEDAKGDALLQGGFDLGPGNYHVDWLMRDRMERPCSSSWDVEATLTPKDQGVNLFMATNEIGEHRFELFKDEPLDRSAALGEAPVNLRLLVNFAPETKDAAALAQPDLSAMISILKTIEHDPRVGKMSLVAFNMQEHRVVYRQEAADRINFPALGTALKTLKLGTVAVGNLGDRHADTEFLGSLIEKELGTGSHSDAVIFAGPKAMLDGDVPQEDLRRIGSVECPVFYMNYNPNPQEMPWKDSISHAVRILKGTEYTITRPRDMFFATSEMLSRITRSKRSHPEPAVAASASR
jgi:hypothetical protein